MCCVHHVGLSALQWVLIPTSAEHGCYCFVLSFPLQWLSAPRAFVQQRSYSPVQSTLLYLGLPVIVFKNLTVHSRVNKCHIYCSHLVLYNLYIVVLQFTKWLHTAQTSKTQACSIVDANQSNAISAVVGSTLVMAAMLQRARNCQIIIVRLSLLLKAVSLTTTTLFMLAAPCWSALQASIICWSSVQLGEVCQAFVFRLYILHTFLLTYC